MVEPVNYQHTLARTQIAEKMQDTAKQQHVTDERAFANELQKLEREREKEVQRAEQDKEGVKVREDEGKKKQGRGQDEHQDAPGASSEAGGALPDEVTDDPDHHIDITA